VGGTQVDNERSAARRELLERDVELATVERLINAPSGLGRLLAIEGPPGIGKTSLILETRTRAEQSGMQVLGARGSELESTFSFGVVRQLYEPFLASLPADERIELFAGAAAFAAPLFEPAQLAEPPPPASLAVLHGLYWLTANVASRAPLLLVLDDLHWCDAPTLRWLAHLLPRLDGLDVLVVVGLRPSEPGADPALLGQIVSDPLTTVVRPAPLSVDAVSLLVRETLSARADDSFCEACHEVTRGNPLLVRELVNALRDEGVEPIADSVPGLEQLAGRAGWRAVSVRLARLPTEATRLAQAVAILGEDADPHRAAELAELSDEDAAAAAASLARVEILRAQPPLDFVHPLIRGAVYETLAPLERSRGHARAASLLADAGADAERIAAQLLLVPPAVAPAGGDERAVAVLREAARSAQCRAAYEGAVAYLRRALEEPPVDAERADVLLELGSAESLISGEASVEHLREAHGLLSDPIARARTAFLIGRLLFFLRPEDSPPILEQALDELGGADKEVASFLEAALISNALFETRLYPEALRRLERARNLPEKLSPAERWLLALLAYHDARANVPAPVVVDLARRVLSARPPLPGEPSIGPWMVACNVLAIADEDEAVTIYDTLLAEARRQGSMLDIALAQVFRAITFVGRGDLADAVAEALEARETFERWGTAPRFLGIIADVLGGAFMEQGRLEDAGAALARVDSGGSADSALLHAYRHKNARLRLLRGDLRGGLEGTLDAGRRFGAIGGRNPALLPWRSQAALALLALGDPDEARRLVTEEVELARMWGAPRALGAALRASGLVEGGADGMAMLQEAVDVLTDSTAKLEHAKACTELGAALRRGRHRTDAREHLRRGLELATICGARPLAARAEAELLATGARPRRISLSGVESLTPSERRVAEMAAEGPTNREIAQALFVTPKTVEVHLSSVYRKLGISSRSQLASALASPVRA
jgi:DNA-binding CsgD family transcriptional regulator/tetratricopeptide (TPR) repeat protein